MRDASLIMQNPQWCLNIGKELVALFHKIWISSIQPDDKNPLFSQIVSIEETYTTFLQHFLSERIRETILKRRLHFRHQSPDHKRNLMDIDIHVTPAVDDSPFSLETICFPVAVIEVGNAATYSLDKKENQATAYALNLANRQNDRLRPFGLLALALTYDHNGIYLRLSHVFANSIDGRNIIFRPLLFSSNHCTADDVNFAFAIIVSFADRISAHWMAKTSPSSSRCLGANVIRIKSDTSDWIFKYYHSDSSRRWAYQQKFLEAEIDFPQSQPLTQPQSQTPMTFTVIKYRFIDGNHKPSHIRHFLALISCLSDIHKLGLVHGDIRLSNCVFLNESQQEKPIALFIDFDFCGEESKDIYPVGFNHKISDGKRHDNALPESPLLKMHDCFSLGL